MLLSFSRREEKKELFWESSGGLMIVLRVMRGREEKGDGTSTIKIVDIPIKTLTRTTSLKASAALQKRTENKSDHQTSLTTFWSRRDLARSFSVVVDVQWKLETRKKRGGSRNSSALGTKQKSKIARGGEVDAERYTGCLCLRRFSRIRSFLFNVLRFLFFSFLWGPV